MTTCTFCNTQYDKNLGFCPRCGTPNALVQSNQFVMQPTENPNQPKKHKKGLLIGILSGIAVLVIIAAIIIGIVIGKNTPTKNDNDVAPEISVTEEDTSDDEENNPDEDHVPDKDDYNEDNVFIDIADELGDYQTSNLIAIDNIIYDTSSTIADFINDGWEVEIINIYTGPDYFIPEYAHCYGAELNITKNNSYFESSVTSETKIADLDDIKDLIPNDYIVAEDSNINMQLPGGIIYGSTYENGDIYDVYSNDPDENGCSYLCDTDYCYLYFTTDTDNIVNYIQYIPYGFS